MTSILLVEDDASLGAALTERLEREGFQVLRAETLQAALKIVDEQKFDVGIIDVSLPDGDGFQVARSIADKKLDVPFLFLTAMNSAEFRLEAFEIGAFDFIPKPFHMKELLLRLEKVLAVKRVPMRQEFRDFAIEHESRSVLFPDGKREQLADKDFLLLQFLIRMSPRALSRQQILEGVWEAGDKANQRTVDNTVVRLREALGPKGKDYLHSQRGVGYFWQVY